MLHADDQQSVANYISTVIDNVLNILSCLLPYIIKPRQQSFQLAPKSIYHRHTSCLQDQNRKLGRHDYHPMIYQNYRQITVEPFLLTSHAEHSYLIVIIVSSTRFDVLVETPQGR